MTIEDLRDIDIEDSLIAELEADGNFNDNFWEIVRGLLFFQIQKYFMDHGTGPIAADQNIYGEMFFGRSIKSKCMDIHENQDILFPYPHTSLKRWMILIAVNITWLAYLLHVIFTYPDILIFSQPILPFFGHLILFLPILIFGVIFKKYFHAKRFSGVTTFHDLIDKLFVLNLWKYKVDDYRRMKVEINEYLKNTPHNTR